MSVVRIGKKSSRATPSLRRHSRERGHYPGVDPLDPTDSTGPFILNVQTDALN